MKGFGKKQCICVIAVIVVLGIAGRCEYNESVIYNMPGNVYEAMKEEMKGASESELVDEYVRNRKYWDEMGVNYELNGVER